MIRISTTILLAAAVFLMTQSTYGAEYMIDANKNCIFLNQSGDPSQKVLKVPLKMNTTYRLSLRQQAYFSPQKGAQADPMPGVVVFYPTNQEDGYDTEYVVLRPGGNLTFRTPGLDPDNVFLLAFVLDHWPQSQNTGAFRLNVQAQ